MTVNERGAAQPALSLSSFDEFLGFFAHELRNQIAGMSGGLQVMEMLGAECSDELLHARDLIARQLLKVQSLLDDLLELSRISRGKATLRKDSVDIAAVLGSALDVWRPLFDERSVKLSVSVAQGLPPVVADRARLTHAIKALLDYAAQAALEGTSARIDVSRVDGRLRLQLHLESALYTDDIPFLFNCFQPRSFHRAHGPLGFALCLAKKAVELQGGQMSAVGQGAAALMMLEIPVGAAEVVESLPDPKASAPGAARRVLIIDDNREAADMLARLVGALGHEAKVAYSGAAGANAAKSFLPNVVLLDLQLPDISGLEVARMIRGGITERPILAALTGNDRDDDRRHCQDAGFDHFYVKPVRLDELRTLLDSICPASAS